jgi:hypothetical protein
MVAERLRRRIAADPFPIHKGERKVEVTISIGLAALTGPEDHAGNVLKHADQALYRAKRDGRNRVVADAAWTRRHSSGPSLRDEAQQIRSCIVGGDCFRRPVAPHNDAARNCRFVRGVYHKRKPQKLRLIGKSPLDQRLRALISARLGIASGLWGPGRPAKMRPRRQ